MPRQFANLGDKLAFSNGIVALSLGAATLIILFGGDQHRLIPLYMIGVFLSFTLSQTGMFLRWRWLRTPGWQVSAAINGVGAVVTGIVLVIVAITKGVEGAWIVMLLIPCLVLLFRETKVHYDNVAAQLSLHGVAVDTTPHGHTVIVPIGGVHRAVVEALRYAAALSKDVTEILADLGLKDPVIPTGQKVAYHSACSMQHGQKITVQPRELLAKAGFEVREIAEGHICCGSAGTYSMLQPELSGRLRERKLGNIAATGAEIVAAGNIGCITHLASRPGHADGARMIHTVELLDWATGGPKPAGLN